MVQTSLFCVFVCVCVFSLIMHLVYPVLFRFHKLKWCLPLTYLLPEVKGQRQVSVGVWSFVWEFPALKRMNACDMCTRICMTRPVSVARCRVLCM